MDSQYWNYAIKGDFDAISHLIRDQSYDQLRQTNPNSEGNNILHLASEYGHVETVKQILCDDNLWLLEEVNSDYDTALHLAARGGHTDVVLSLIEKGKRLYAENGDRQPQRWHCLVRLTNDEGNTVVHEATRYNRTDVVTILLKKDRSFEHSRNKSKETPLYLASSRGFHNTVDAIIQHSAQTMLRYHGPDGRTALHGAVLCNSKDCTTKLLRWEKNLLYEQDFCDGTYHDHIYDHHHHYINDQTPLHYAAQLGFADLVKELLDMDTSIVYSTNHKRRNVLHIAVEHGQKDVVEYLLEECPLLVNRLIIKKDVDGNTPLHLLATSNCYVPKLINHPMADKGAVNNDGFTPLELLNKSSAVTEAKEEIAVELKRVGAVLYLPNVPAIPDLDPVIAERRRMIENHTIVAGLITTVAFTAGFAMPGGYIESGKENQGMAILGRNSPAFQAFIISDAIALLASTSALFVYFLSALKQQFLKNDMPFARHPAVAMCLNMIALVAIIAAFISGTYYVTPPKTPLRS